MEFKGMCLMNEYRGNVLENVHYGHICCINENREIFASAGNPNHYTYMRSTAKPIQILPLLDMELDRKYRLTDWETTIIAGSQFGAEYHVKTLESISEKMGLSEDTLICLPSYPLDDEHRQKLYAAQKPARRFYHVCAGKHLGILAISKELGTAASDYNKPESAVQKLIKRYIAQITGYREDYIEIGIDGCGVPVFAVPLSHMAEGFLNLILPERIANPQTRRSARQIVELYQKNPDYITNNGYLCTELNKDANIFAKGGADGVYCFALKKEKIAVAFKIADGSEVEWNIIIAHILKELGYANSETVERILKLHPKEIISASGVVCGRYEPVFRL